MTRLTALLAGIVVVSGLVTSGVALAAEAEGTPTYTKDIAPIVFDNCVVCHRPGQVAPMALRNYAETRPWARAIKEKVASREMPPWFADPQFGEWLNDRRLTQEQIDAVVAWVDAGAPKGEDADLPEFPKFAEGWALGDLGDPDAMIPLPITVHVPAEGEEGYVDYYVPVPFEKDEFIKGIEVRPTNRAVVHHVTVNVSGLPPGTRLTDRGTAERDPSIQVERGQNVFSEDASFKLIGYAPGKGFQRYRPGSGKRIPVGRYLQFNTHYTPTGQPETDRTELGLWFHDGPVNTEIIQKLVGGVYLTEGREVVAGPGQRRPEIPNIPPHVDNWKIVAMTPFTEEITLYGLAPHMHLRGKDMKYVVVRPDGSEETLLSVPKYDFNWQLFYELAEPIRIPAGSKLMTIGHFDNSIKNRYNPAPDKEVYWAEQSWDEMFNGFYEYSVDLQSQKPTTEE